MNINFKLTDSYYLMCERMRDLADNCAGMVPSAEVQQMINVLDIDWTPEYKTAGAACADILSVDAGCIMPGSTWDISTGLSLELPVGWEAVVRSRSGLWFNYRVDCFEGTIDSDYRGEIKISLTNNGRKPFYFKEGDRLAQLKINPAVQCKFVPVEVLNETVRGGKGFGSTGVGKEPFELEVGAMLTADKVYADGDGNRTLLIGKKYQVIWTLGSSFSIASEVAEQHHFSVLIDRTAFQELKGGVMLEDGSVV